MSVSFDDFLTCSLDRVRNFKCYGLVKRNGKEFWRNYNRELKNGKGKSVWDLTLDSLFKPSPLYEQLTKKVKNSEKV